jgi:flagellar biosynthesis/type III secretory pathway protein FliH
MMGDKFWMDEKGPYQDGYRAGYEDGRKESKNVIADLREQNARLAAEVKQLQGDLYQKLGSTSS